MERFQLLARQYGGPHEFMVFFMLSFLDDQMKKGSLSEGFVAFEMLSRLVGFLDNRPREMGFERLWPKSYDQSGDVVIPFQMIVPFVAFWKRYREHEGKVAIGHVLGIEGGASGKNPEVQRFDKLMERYEYANEVLFKRIESAQNGAPISLSKARGLVAAEHGVSEETVRDAWKRQGKWLREFSEELGILHRG